VEEFQLVLLAKQGDENAFEELVRRNAQYVYNLALRVVRDPNEAEDLAQEAFVRVWKSLPGFRIEASFRTWLYRIMTNLCFDRLPRLKKEFAELEIEENIELEDDMRNPEGNTLSSEMMTELHSAIEDLPDSYRVLITLRHLQEMSYAEIAEVTGQPLGTVKTGIYRARQILKEKLKKFEVAYG
jgi:RNA polymerase sigma-70 factor (ECF subfamily)